jgi:hypothetical protein
MESADCAAELRKTGGFRVRAREPVENKQLKRKILNCGLLSSALAFTPVNVLKTKHRTKSPIFHAAECTERGSRVKPLRYDHPTRAKAARAGALVRSAR